MGDLPPRRSFALGLPEFPFAKEETTLKGTSNSVKCEVQAKWVTTAAYARCASGCMLAQVLVLKKLLDAACVKQQAASAAEL